MIDIDDLDVVIRRVGGKVVAGVPRLALYATAATTASALELLDQKKKALRDDIAAAGMAELPPEAVPGVPTQVDHIGRFAMKASIVAVLTLLVMGISGALVANRIEASVTAMVGSDRIGGRQFWTGLERALNAAEPANEMPPERRKKLLSNIRVLVDRYRPFVAEVSQLFSPPPSGR
jgi:hypothetical protein